MSVNRVTPVLLALSVILWTSPAAAQCSAGDPIQQGCGAYSFEGCCEGQILLWCENGWLCGSDCTLLPYCGWDAAQGFYNCDTIGQAAPNNNPSMECPSVTDVDNDGYEAPADCDDTNPNINPGAQENCGNNVDDDCDGYIDGNDADCSGDDDSEADDDVGDDDATDDDGSDDDADDDDTEESEDDENPNLGVVCGCRVDGGRPAATLVGLGVLALILAVRFRR